MSYQATTLGAHIRHTVSNKDQWDALKREYVRTYGGEFNEIRMIEDLIVIAIVALAQMPSAK